MNKLLSIALATALFATSGFAQQAGTADVKVGAKVELGATVANLVEDTTADGSLTIKNRGTLYFSTTTQGGPNIAKDPIVIENQNGIVLGAAITDDEGTVHLATAKDNWEVASDLTTALTAAYPIDRLVEGILWNGGENETGSEAYLDVRAASTALDGKGFDFQTKDDIYLDLTTEQNNKANLIMSSHDAVKAKNVFVTVPELDTARSLDANFASLNESAEDGAATASRIILKGNAYMNATDNFELNGDIAKQGTFGIDCFNAAEETPKYVYVGTATKSSQIMTVSPNNHLVVPAQGETAKTFEVPADTTLVVHGFVETAAGVADKAKAGKITVGGRIVVEGGGKVFLGAKDYNE